MSRRRRPDPTESMLFSPLLDVLMNALATILLLLVAYVYVTRGAGPPIIILSEDNPVYRFASGSAEITEGFKQEFVREYLPQLERYTKHYRTNVVEVVGHTDAQPVGASTSNLDALLIPAYHQGRAAELRPGSNVDLGLMRALAVVEMMRELQAEGYLSGIEFFHPISSGQLLLADRQPATVDEARPDISRRRIEIRILRSATTVVSPPG